MSDVKHTPGPWKAAPEANGEWGIDSATGWGIATVAGSAGPGPGDDESAANARLIAAAPELLAELKRMVQHFEVWANDWPEVATTETWAALHCSKAAITKAEGRTP